MNHGHKTVKHGEEKSQKSHSGHVLLWCVNHTVTENLTCRIFCDIQPQMLLPFDAHPKVQHHQDKLLILQKKHKTLKFIRSRLSGLDDLCALIIFVLGLADDSTSLLLTEQPVEGLVGPWHFAIKGCKDPVKERKSAVPKMVNVVGEDIRQYWRWGKLTVAENWVWVMSFSGWGQSLHMSINHSVTAKCHFTLQLSITLHIKTCHHFRTCAAVDLHWICHSCMQSQGLFLNIFMSLLRQISSDRPHADHDEPQNLHSAKVPKQKASPAAASLLHLLIKGGPVAVQ